MSVVADPPAAPPVTPPAAAPAPSWDAGIFDTAKPGGFVENWSAKAPDPAKLAPYAGAKSFGELMDIVESRMAENQTALRNKQAGGLPTRPKVDAPPEYWTAYREAHGLPQTPEGYEVKRPAGVAEELWNGEKVGEFTKLAHDLDMKPEQVQKMLEWYHGDLQNIVAGDQKSRAEAQQKLVQKEALQMATLWGDKVDGTLGDLQSIAKAFEAPAEWFDPASDKFAGPDFANFVAKLLARMPRGEGNTLQNMGAPTPTGQYDMAWVNAAMKSGHPDYEAFRDVRHARHGEVMKLRDQAFAMASRA